MEEERSKYSAAERLKNWLIEDENGNKFFICIYCGDTLGLDEVTVDHKQPRSKGGKDGAYNRVPSCTHCNGVKRDMTYSEFMLYIKDNTSRNKIDLNDTLAKIDRKSRQLKQTNKNLREEIKRLRRDKESLIIRLIKHEDNMENKLSYLDQVEEFHNKFKHPVLGSPVIPSQKRVHLRLGLILEELIELAEAAGELETMFGLMEHQLEKNRLKKETSAVDSLDALCDLQYVLSGAVLEFGMKDIFDKAFEEVHNSNMSKACLTKADVVDTIAKHHIDHPGEEIRFDKAKDGTYLCYRVSDNKTIKNANYKPANLTQFIEPSNDDQED